MIRSLRLFFLSRLLREKLLLLAFIGFGLVWWSAAFSRKAGLFWREKSATTRVLKEQADWIGRRNLVDAATQQAAARLVPEKTLDVPRLIRDVNQAAADAGLKVYSSSGATSEKSGDMSVHTVTYTISGAPWAALNKFYELLERRSPYIGIESFTLQSAARGNPSLDSLNLTLKVSSVEVPH